MIDLKPGRELDEAVAKAVAPCSLYHCPYCGLYKLDYYTLNDGAFCSCERPVGGPIPRLECVPFRPSTDLNAAFAAAESAGLFDGRSLYRDDEGWHIGTFYYGAEDYEDVSVAPTIALAICAAILKLKE